MSQAEKQTVFVVDDDASFLSAIRRLLLSGGYANVCFSSAADFLAQRPAGSAGCVLADLRMPGMDDMALQETLAQSSDPLPVVFLYLEHWPMRPRSEAMRQKVTSGTALLLSAMVMVWSAAAFTHRPSAADCAAEADRAARSGGTMLGGAARGAAGGAVFGAIVGNKKSARKGAALGAFVGGASTGARKNNVYNRVYDDCMRRY